MRRSAVTAAERGVRLTVRQGTERARLSIIVRRLEKNDRRQALQNIWHFVDSGRRSFSHSSMRCLVLYNTSTRSHASPPTTPAPVSGAQLCSRYRRIARLVRIVSFRSNRFFSAPK